MRSASRTCSAKAVGRFYVAHDDELLASFGRSQHVLGIDRPAVRQNDRLSFRQIFAHRTVRHTESRKAVGQQMATHLAHERKREAFGIAMTHTETVDGELAGVEDPPLGQRNELQRDGRPSLAPESGEHPDDDVERPRAAVDRHDIGALPQPQRRKQTRNAEHVVEMAERQQEPVEASEASAAAEQLALRTLPAVDHDAVAPRVY
jgi:hypothetical protein